MSSRTSRWSTASDAYCATHVRVRLPHGAVVVRPCAAPGRSDPPAGPLHVVTACAPGSATRREDDDARMQLLAAELCGMGVCPAVGADAAGEHSEPSLAVSGLSDEAACSLGARYGQVAVFAWRARAGPCSPASVTAS